LRGRIGLSGSAAVIAIPAGRTPSMQLVVLPSAESPGSRRAFRNNQALNPKNLRMRLMDEISITKA
jgi:hypothetical protein